VSGHVCIAFDDRRPARWALGHAAALARRSSARVTIAHVMPPVDVPVDPVEALLGLDEPTRQRGRLDRLAARLLPDVEWRVRLLVGRVEEQLPALTHEDPPDVLITGTRPLRGLARLGAPRARHGLLADVRCPLVLVAQRPAEPEPLPVVLAFGRTDAPGDPALAAGAELAALLRCRLLCLRAPRHPRDAPALDAAATARVHRPLLAVVAAERFPSLERRLGVGHVDPLLAAIRCPVAVVGRRARAATRAPRRAGARRPVGRARRGAVHAALPGSG
jgi:nucleotide-binding universal stress UspA family protein